MNYESSDAKEILQKQLSYKKESQNIYYFLFTIYYLYYFYHTILEENATRFFRHSTNIFYSYLIKESEYVGT